MDRLREGLDPEYRKRPKKAKEKTDPIMLEEVKMKESSSDSENVTERRLIFIE
jgi:hypothetical protein